MLAPVSVVAAAGDCDTCGRPGKTRAACPLKTGRLMERTEGLAGRMRLYAILYLVAGATSVSLFVIGLIGLVASRGRLSEFAVVTAIGVILLVILGVSRMGAARDCIRPKAPFRTSVPSTKSERRAKQLSCGMPHSGSETWLVHMNRLARPRRAATNDHRCFPSCC